MSKIAISGASTGSATFTIESPATSTNRTLTLPDNTGTIITQNSTPAFASTIGVGGATAAASGAGITFPATQSASSDANTLDDYEEGTWTPTITSQTGTITSSAFTGRYTKVGNFVFVSGQVTIVNAGTGGNDLYLTLPIPSSSDFWGGCGVELLTVGYTASVAGLINGSMVMRKFDWTTVINSGHGIRFSAVYPV